MNPFQAFVKGILHPKIKILSLSLTPMLFRARKTFVRLRNNIKYILDKNREACDCPIDCQVNCKYGPEKYENHRQNTPSAISGSILL